MYGSADNRLGLIAGSDIAQKNMQMPTVRERIENQIELHKQAILRLEKTRENLDKQNFLDWSVSDFHEMLNY